MTKIIFLYFFDVYSVVGYASFLYVIETVYKICNSCLSRTCSADKSDLLTGFCKQRYVVEYSFSFFIGEVDVVETHIAF